MWSSRQRVGMVYPKSRQRYLNLAPVTNDNLIHSISRDNVLNMANEMRGEGILDLAKEGYQKAKNIGSKVASFYSSQTAKDLIDLLPDSDATAAKGFAGEKHGILQLANGKYGVGNFIGPGTQVIKRLRRGDKGRTKVDSVSMRHDIDFAIAQGAKSKKEQLKLGRAADKRMINSLNRLEASGGDAKKNILMGKAIKGKVLLEDVGLMNKDKFLGEMTNINDKDMILLKSKRAELSQEGYGMPGEKLKHQLLMKMGKGTNLAGKKRGKGINLAGKKRGKGVNLAGFHGGSPNLAGVHRGGAITSLNGFITTGLIPNLAKDLGISKKIATAPILKILKSTNPKNVNDIASVLSKSLMPYLVKGKIDTINKHTGSGIEQIKQIVKDVPMELYNKLKAGIKKALDFYFKEKQGGGSCCGMTGGSWASFWASFKKGFKVVVKIGLQVGAIAATAMGHPEVGAIASGVAGLL